MSVSAGNDGSSCSTVLDPPAIYEDVTSIGATGSRTNTIASYSSRGPVTVDGSDRPKPDLVAPGSGVRSCYPPNRYATLSGTSMASPAVTGSIPLLWQAVPSLVRKVVETQQKLEVTAVHLTTTTATCGVPAGTTPNAVYGHGLIELDKATQ